MAGPDLPGGAREPDQPLARLVRAAALTRPVAMTRVVDEALHGVGGRDADILLVDLRQQELRRLGDPSVGHGLEASVLLSFAIAAQLADLDVATEHLRIVSAGHPRPLLPAPRWVSSSGSSASRSGSPS